MYNVAKTTDLRYAKSRFCHEVAQMALLVHLHIHTFGDKELKYITKGKVFSTFHIFMACNNHPALEFRLIYFKSNRKEMNRNWCNQKANPALKSLEDVLNDC